MTACYCTGECKKTGVCPHQVLAPLIVPNPAITALPVSRCWKCNMEMKGSMGYVCGSGDCPTFIKSTC